MIESVEQLQCLVRELRREKVETEYGKKKLKNVLVGREENANKVDFEI